MLIRTFPCWILLTALPFFYACSHQELQSVAIVTEEAKTSAQATKQTPESLIQQSELLLQDALKNDLAFYSPLHMAKAEQSLQTAKQYLSNPSEHVNNAASISAIATKGFIERAKTNKSKAMSSLADTFANHKLLIEIDTPTIFPERYQSVKSQIGELLKKYEQGNIREALEGQEEVISALIQLEIDTQKKNHLSEAYSAFQQATDANAEEFAPKSYYETQKLLEESARYISKNNRNKIGISKQAEKAKVSALNTLNISKDAKRLVELTPEESEQYVLKLNAQLKELSNAHGQNTPQISQISDSIEQAIKIAKVANKTLINYNASMAQKLETIENLETKIKDLEAQQQEQISSIFSDDYVSNEPTVFYAEESNEESFDTVEMVDEP